MYLRVRKILGRRRVEQREFTAPDRLVHLFACHSRPAFLLRSLVFLSADVGMDAAILRSRHRGRVGNRRKHADGNQSLPRTSIGAGLHGRQHH